MSSAVPTLLSLYRRRSLYYRSLLNPFLAYKSLLLNDKWVIESVFKGKKNGYFVEAGAHDGVFNSSCYALEKRFGWTGICIEPDDRFNERCTRNRPNSIVDRTALSDRNDEAVFVQAAIAGYSGLKKSLQNAEENARNEGWTKDHWRTSGSYAEKRVAVTTLENLLEKHNAPNYIDYLALDIEGSEKTVLGCFPFDKYRFGCISIEGSGCNDLLTANGFLKVENCFNRVGPWEQYFIHTDILAA
jgi:FkbM family methyltransferase